MANRNLTAARAAKNDEFYTQLYDIENELKHYKDQFKDKVVFLNCDDPEESEFWKYFELNFDLLGLKKLISTHFDAHKPTYKLELVGDVTGDGKTDDKDIIKTMLKQNGDFRSDEAIEILKSCDIVVTNPPFSLFREFIAQLIEYDKDFLVVGNKNSITYKEIFPLIKDNKLWLGYTALTEFILPSGDISTNMKGLAIWFTNLPTTKRQEDIILVKTYNPIDYPKYDNYDAINVDKVVEIPKDYDGVMGVPITFLGRYNPNQFEIIDANNVCTNLKINKKPHGLVKDKDSTINGKAKYARILIRKL